MLSEWLTRFKSKIGISTKIFLAVTGASDCPSMLIQIFTACTKFSGRLVYSFPALALYPGHS